MKAEYIEWMAFGIGLLGAIAWAVEYKYNGRSIEGFLFILSALLWIWFAVSSSLIGLAARDYLGFLVAMVGIATVGITDLKTYLSGAKSACATSCPICEDAAQLGPGSHAYAMRTFCANRKVCDPNMPCQWN